MFIRNLAPTACWRAPNVLAVLTNNGWFGEGGAAYQHASHAVLRAVETRRPVHALRQRRLERLDR
jgi:apolipoprotein N-acyltransferase